ncbi:Uncharacterised protein [Bordetella ansorpii]|uniref:Lipoprotein n=1 Tax=Bordetella ansorpii TaxID=288768 RepID=A0A157SJJ6_9BORD|nr:hypothetical protein [Bordetella ansorpii]SAI70464.1 Uncharacterised protein [Bordetella ansorpii]
MKRVMTAVLPGLLSGCMAMSPAEIRAVRPEVYQSSAGVDEIMRCLRVDDDAKYLEVTPYPESGRLEFEFRTFQGFSPVVLYLASAERLGTGSRIEGRFSGKSSMSITETEFRGLMKRCAPPA